MKSIFDEVSISCCRKVTASYSTSFSLAVNMLSPSIRSAIHSIYGFVRLADEIVDSFHGWDKEALLLKFENDYYEAQKLQISLNPILNAFQQTVREYDIDRSLIDSFLKSMRMDLFKNEYKTKAEYESYIYGSADVVGLMCLKVFVNGDEAKFEKLKASAMRLGSAFQKVNFLRDLKNDMEILNRNYFPHIDVRNLDKSAKRRIINEIEEDFAEAYKGIVQLPASSKFGVYTAYIYYSKLLQKMKETPSTRILQMRIQINNFMKIGLLVKSYVNIKFNLL